MPYKSVLVGIDASPAAMAAARLGQDLARRTGGRCRFAHATYDVSAIPALVPPGVDAVALVKQVSGAERERISAWLAGVVESDPSDLTVRVGTPQWVIREVAGEVDADLVIVGGKHHAALARWLGGSTAHHLIQTLDRPVLVVNPERQRLRRIMAAIDLSEGSGHVLRAAEELAMAVEGACKVVHAIEPLPVPADHPTVFNHAAFAAWSEATFSEIVDGLDRPVERGLYRGKPDEVIDQASAAWKTDVLVVGSQGRGFVDRMLLGSTAHRLLTRLPTSLLVVPVGALRDREGALDPEASHRAAVG